MRWTDYDVAKAIREGRTPEVPSEYLARFKARPGQWHPETGEERREKINCADLAEQARTSPDVTGAEIA